ncbi:MAG: hypothetical protein HPY50_06730 [Firmicutes bacterium]|nr:hypothetical protein [Bacillota bacterium]
MRSRAGFFAAVTALIVILVLISLPSCSMGPAEKPVIMEGVQVAGVAVGGLTLDQSRDKLQLETRGSLGRVVDFRLGEQVWSSSLERLGVTLDVDGALQQALAIGNQGALDYINYRFIKSEQRHEVPLKYKYDDDELEAAIMRLTADFQSEARESRLEVGPKDDLILIEGRSGLKIDTKTAFMQLDWKLDDGYTPSREKDSWEFYLATESSVPTLKGQTLKQLGVERLLSTFTTRFDPGLINRTYNIKIAADAINQMIIKPGEVFSFNDVVGPRSEETGYREALVIYMGEFVPGVGGGVCQVSSTLYNALLRADVKIVERNNHSLIIDYVLLGTDATVQYGSQDLKFENDTGHNLIIQTKVEKNTLTVQLFGKKDNIPKITLTNEVIERIPPGRIEKPNPNLEAGQERVETKGKWGARVRSYRVIGEGENTRTELLNSDTYQAIDEVVQVGIKPVQQEPPKTEPPKTEPPKTQPPKDQTGTGTTKPTTGTDPSKGNTGSGQTSPNPTGSKPKGTE